MCQTRILGTEKQALMYNRRGMLAKEASIEPGVDLLASGKSPCGSIRVAFLLDSEPFVKTHMYRFKSKPALLHRFLYTLRPNLPSAVFLPQSYRDFVVLFSARDISVPPQSC